MKFRSLLGVALALCASVFLTSCGGGGAQAPAGNPGASLTIAPANGVLYAGVPITFSVTGGRLPYTITSNEPSLLPVPTTLNGHSFTTVAANPGVTDTGTGGTTGIVPSRTVSLHVTSADNEFTDATLTVNQNFLTGYGFRFTTQACSTPPPASTGGSSALTPTGGCDTVMVVSAITAGNLLGDATFRFDAVTGNFSFVDPNTGNSVNSLTTTTDHNGVATVIVRVPATAQAQIGVFRITEVQSGVSTTNAFTIQGNSNASSLTAIPNSFTFTGALTTDCGTGVGDFFVFGGSPPYAAQSSDPNVAVRPVNANAQPGEFEITASNPSVCLTNATIVVTDSVGAHTTVTVTTAAGSTAPPAPPPPALQAQPTSVSLPNCGQSASVTVVGGSSTTYSASSTLPDLTTAVSGNTVTITRVANDAGLNPPFPASQTVRITDGTSIVNVTVTTKQTCP